MNISFFPIQSYVFDGNCLWSLFTLHMVSLYTLCRLKHVKEWWRWRGNLVGLDSFGQCSDICLIHRRLKDQSDHSCRTTAETDCSSLRNWAETLADSVASVSLHQLAPVSLWHFDRPISVADWTKCRITSQDTLRDVCIDEIKRTLLTRLLCHNSSRVHCVIYMEWGLLWHYGFLLSSTQIPC